MTSKYKRILLLNNENYYSKDKVLNIIRKFRKPQFIDEIWCGFYMFEESWDYKLEEFTDQVVGIEYLQMMYS